MVRYSCTIPGNLFVGYDAMLRDIKDGLRDGDSFAIIGLGKSSMLEQMKEVLPNSPNIKPRVLDIYELNTVSLNILYKKLYSLCIKEIPNAPEWKDGNDDSAYQKFQDILTSAKPLIDTKYSDNWIMVFLINKIERLAEKLNDRRFFDNMANFRMHSDFKRHFRIIATGGRMLSYLTQTGSIFSGILKKHYLGILKEGDAQLLIQKGFPYGFKPDVERLFLRMTGCNPYIMQGLLEKLKLGSQIEVADLDIAKSEFIQNRHEELKKWLKKLGNLEITIYHLLSKSQTGTLSRDEIKKAIPSSLTHCITEILLVLKYSGLIDGTDMSTPKIAGDIFREWFMENCPQEDIILNGQDAMIKSTQIILEAINNSALRDDKKAEVKKILDGEINNIQSAGSEDTVNKRSLKTSLETALSLLKTTDVSITTMTNLSKHVESLGQFLGDTFNWWL